MHRLPPTAKQGQAIVEFVVGLLGMIVLIGGAIQLIRLGMIRTDLMAEATASASIEAMDALGGPDVPADYILANVDGPDGYAYSEDDTFVGGDLDEAFARLGGRLDADRALPHAPASDIAGILAPGDIPESFGFVRANATDLNIPLLPVIRNYVMGQESIDLRVEVWQTQTGNFY